MDEITVFGLDLGEYYSQISYYRESMEDAKSISLQLGSKSYLIPTVVAKREENLKWYVGQEAMEERQKVEGFLSAAFGNNKVTVNREEVEAKELLLLFLRRIFSMAASVGLDKERDYFVICLEKVTGDNVKVLEGIMEELGFSLSHVKICDRKEAFCHYIMKQEAKLRLHDVLLLDYWKNSFQGYLLHTDTKFSPHVISVEELYSDGISEIFDKKQFTKEEYLIHKDTVLNRALDEYLGKRIISSCYLVGDGFEGSWMNHSLSRLCTGRRAFLGMNLYTKGACFYGMSKSMEQGIPDFVYLGGENLLYNVCMKVYHKGEYIYKTLINAGLNWQDAKGSAEVILAGEEDPSIEIVCKSMNQGEDKKMDCILDQLNVRPDKTTRLHIDAYASSCNRIVISVKTTGFGMIVKDEPMNWQFTIRL
ncbi:MAG: hypothetical protein K6A30_01695 [Lachnospiraceae bacterium]|nr:hypothetical protein [Lachnospiraceae bacterium]